MEDGEPTNTTDTSGTQTNIPVEKPLSLVEEAQKVRDEIKAENDRREKILQEEQKLKSEEMLGGTTGGNVEPKMVSDEERKKTQAKEFFKGTQLEETIDKL